MLTGAAEPGAGEREDQKMMSYELFRDIVSERIKEFLPEEFGDYRVELRRVRKVNQSLDCLNLMPPDNSAAASPNIYIEEIYKEFEEFQDMDRLLKQTAELIVYTYQKLQPSFGNIDFSQWKDQIVINLVNREENEELLKELPHRDLLDLSVIYRFIMGKSGNNLATVRVDHHLLEEIRMTEDELHRLALENTRRMFPVVTQTMDEMRITAEEMLEEIDEKKTAVWEEGAPCPREGSVSDIRARGKAGGELKGKSEIINSIQFITNSIHLQGAAGMLYDDELQAVADKMKSSFYVIPSSVHEVIAVSERFADPGVLTNMLREANAMEFVGVEKLSDNLYFYDRDQRRLSIA